MKKLLVSITAISVLLLVAFQLGLFGSQKSLLETYALEDMSVESMVLALETKTIDTTGLVASINSKYLVLETENEKVNVSLPEDRFYLSFAPYIDNTHPCNTHFLTSCQNELRNESFHVKVVLADGTVIIDETLTSASNGFVGIWLPRDVEAVLHVEYENLHVSSPITTFESSPTCLTTPLQLVEKDSLLS
jgi:hypothetical protein